MFRARTTYDKEYPKAASSSKKGRGITHEVCSLHYSHMLQHINACTPYILPLHQTWKRKLLFLVLEMYKLIVWKNPIGAGGDIFLMNIVIWSFHKACYKSARWTVKLKIMKKVDSSFGIQRSNEHFKKN